MERVAALGVQGRLAALGVWDAGRRFKVEAPGGARCWGRRSWRRFVPGDVWHKRPPILDFAPRAQCASAGHRSIAASRRGEERPSGRARAVRLHRLRDQLPWSSSRPFTQSAPTQPLEVRRPGAVTAVANSKCLSAGERSSATIPSELIVAKLAKTVSSSADPPEDGGGADFMKTLAMDEKIQPK